MKKAIQFGAGNIGRGFIGYLLHKSGYHVTFVDINEEILNAINKEKKYKIFIKDNNCYEEDVDNIDAINTLDENLKEYISQAEIITTAVGPTILSKIAGSILKGIVFKKENNINTFLNIIACEMEAFALFYMAKYFNRKAACLLTVVDSHYKNQVSTPEERERSLNDIIKLALQSV